MGLGSSMNNAYWKHRAANAKSDFEKVGWLEGTGEQFRDHHIAVSSVVQAFCKNGVVLDVGCGFGRFCVPVVLAGGHWIGVDQCEAWEAEWHARPEYDGVRGSCEFLIADCSDPSAWFHRFSKVDVILASGVVGNMGWTVDRFMQEYRPALSDGGVFVVSSGFNLIEVRL